MWPGPSIITWQPCSHAFCVSSPSVLSFGELGLVVGVGEASGTQAVAEAVGDVVSAHDLAQLAEVRVPGVLLVVGQHPRAHQRAAAADDAGDPVRRQRQVFLQHAGMDRHVIDALLGLVLDHVEHLLRRDVGGVLDVLDDLVDGHRSDRHRRGVDDRLADGVDVAAGRQVHHGVGAKVDGGVQLFQLVVDRAGDGGVADVRVDLAQGRDADRHWLEVLLEVVDVGRDDHAAARDLGTNQVGVEVFPLGDEVHLRSDRALAGSFELGHGCKSPWVCAEGAKRQALSRRFDEPVICQAEDGVPET